LAKTLLNLINDTLIEVNEAANTTAFSFASGTGTNAVTTSNHDVLMQWANDAKDHLCRTCFLYSITGTLALVSPTTSLYDLSQFTFTGKVFNFLHHLTWTPTGSSAAYLPEVAWEAMLDYNPSMFVIPPTAVPSKWSDQPDNQPGFYLDSIPNTNGTLTATGYGLPVDMTSDSDTISWIPDNYYRAFICFMAGMAIRKRVDDPILVAKYLEFQREYDSIRVNLRSQVSPDLAMAVFGPFVPWTPPQVNGAPAQNDGE